MKKIKVRLKRDHYLNGVKKNAGTVVTLPEFAADQLLKNKLAEPVKTKG